MKGVAEDEWYIVVNSSALAYTVISLLLSLIMLYGIFLVRRHLRYSKGPFKLRKMIIYEYLFYEAAKEIVKIGFTTMSKLN